MKLAYVSLFSSCHCDTVGVRLFDRFSIVKKRMWYSGINMINILCEIDVRREAKKSMSIGERKKSECKSVQETQKREKNNSPDKKSADSDVRQLPVVRILNYWC